MDEYKGFNKLDLWVAETIMGYKTHQETSGKTHWTDDEGKLYYEKDIVFTVIMDLAMKAAVKAGLWVDNVTGHPRYLGFADIATDYVYRIWEYDDKDKIFSEVSQDKLPARAICLALYKITTGEDWD